MYLIKKYIYSNHDYKICVFDFRENRTKVNMIFNSNNTVTYMQLKSWQFDPDLSNGSLSDQVTTINIILNVNFIINIVFIFVN